MSSSTLAQALSRRGARGGMCPCCKCTWLQLFLQLYFISVKLCWWWWQWPCAPLATGLEHRLDAGWRSRQQSSCPHTRVFDQVCATAIFLAIYTVIDDVNETFCCTPCRPACSGVAAHTAEHRVCPSDASAAASRWRPNNASPNMSYAFIINRETLRAPATAKRLPHGFPACRGAPSGPVRILPESVRSQGS